MPSTFPPRLASSFSRSFRSSPADLQFKKLLAPGKIGQTLCLGNLTDKRTYEYLRAITPDLKIVKGRFDVEATALPLTQVVTHGAIRVGFLEGFTLVSTEPEILMAEANRLDVDVLCFGGTHKFECFEYMDKLFINPGSATGAYFTGWGGDATDPDDEIVPSFCLLDVCLPLVLSSLYGLTRSRYKGISLTVYIYRIRKDANGVQDIAIEKVTYTKPVEPTGPAS